MYVLDCVSVVFYRPSSLPSRRVMLTPLLSDTKWIASHHMLPISYDEDLCLEDQR